MSAAPKWPEATKVTSTRLQAGQRVLVYRYDEGGSHERLLPVNRNDKADRRRAAFTTTVTAVRRYTKPRIGGNGHNDPYVDVHTEAGSVLGDANHGVWLVVP